MIPAWKVQAIESLLAEGRLSQRQIAKRVKVWRGTVAGIAGGTRPPCHGAERGRAADSPRHEEPPERCPGCGGLVHLPCLACRTRAQPLRRSRSMAGPADADERLELRLLAVHRVRYEEIRRRLVPQTSL